MKTRLKPGPVRCRLQPWIAGDGTPFIAYATTRVQPDGIKIVGNGTLTHPLNVELSGAYAAAPEMLQVLRQVNTMLDGMSRTPSIRKAWHDGAFESSVHDAFSVIASAIAKATGGAK